jgi:hypothetical protein
VAYREFHVEPIYEAPNLDGFLEGSTAAISSLFRSMGQRAVQRRTAADQFKYDLEGGSFENDTKVLNEYAKNVTDRARQEIRQTGRLSQETDKMQIEGKGLKKISENQFQRAKELSSKIAGKQDKYYNPEPDLKLVTWATVGEDNDVDFRTRGERLAKAEKEMGGVDTFRFQDYRADYVKNIGTQYKKIVSGNPNAKSTNYNQATFWDNKTGKPGVTDDHAIDYIESDRRVAQWYDDKVSKQLDREIKGMKASGDTRVDWMKGMSEADIKNTLMTDPSKNIVNSQTYGSRVRDMAKGDLAEADRVNSEVAYDSTGDKNNSGGRWTNSNILQADSINSFAQQAKSAETGEFKPVTTFGPGGKLTQRNGRAIQVDTTNPIRTSINRGITTRNNKGSLNLNMTGYQLMPVRKGMAPFSIKSNTTEGMIEEINNMPLEYFDPNGKMALQPELKIGLSGYTINEAGVLGDVNDQLFSIADQLREARDKNDSQAISALQEMEMDLKDLVTMIGAGDYDQRDLIVAANKAGVRKTKDDWIIPADAGDIATIKNITGGFDLNDKSFWSDEMKAVQEAYSKRYSEAQASGFKDKTADKQDDMVQVIAPDGRTGKIPRKNLDQAIKAGYKQQ